MRSDSAFGKPQRVWQAGHAGVEAEDAPPVMTADNWNVTDIDVIADKLHKH